MIKKFLVAALLFLTVSSLAIADSVVVSKAQLLRQVEAAALAAKPVALFNFQSIQVAQAVQLIYTESLKVPYVISPEILLDTRVVSFRYEAKNGDLRPFVVSFLDSLDLAIVNKSGVDFVGKKIKAVGIDSDVDVDQLVYRPRFRDVSYLTQLLSPLFKGAFSTVRSVRAGKAPSMTDKAVPESSAAAQVDQAGDVLIFSSTAKEVSLLKKLLGQVDDRQSELSVRAVVYEVSSDESTGSAFGLAVNILGGKLGAGVGVVNPANAFFRLSIGGIDAVVSALASDSRFNVMSAPSIRVRSGSTGRFQAGQDVPVLGAVSYPGNGAAPVQAVDYRSSGVIFDVQPTARDDVIDLTVGQQLSNFVATLTGVVNSPTLIKRDLRTSLSVVDGEIVVLGGLSETKDTAGRSGPNFLPAFFKSKTGQHAKTEILLILQVQRIVSQESL